MQNEYEKAKSYFEIGFKLNVMKCVFGLGSLYFKDIDFNKMIKSHANKLMNEYRSTKIGLNISELCKNEIFNKIKQILIGQDKNCTHCKLEITNNNLYDHNECINKCRNLSALNISIYFKINPKLQYHTTMVMFNCYDAIYNIGMICLSYKNGILCFNHLLNALMLSQEYVYLSKILRHYFAAFGHDSTQKFSKVELETICRACLMTDDEELIGKCYEINMLNRSTYKGLVEYYIKKEFRKNVQIL